MVLKNLCILAFCMKVNTALEGLRYFFPMFCVAGMYLFIQECFPMSFIAGTYLLIEESRTNNRILGLSSTFVLEYFFYTVLCCCLKAFI